ncbi:MAG: hypothetical protein ABF876_05180 [Acetobacter aceti]
MHLPRIFAPLAVAAILMLPQTTFSSTKSSYRVLERSGQWQAEADDAAHSARIATEQDGFRLVLSTNISGGRIGLGAAVFRHNAKSLTLHLNGMNIEFGNAEVDPNTFGMFTDFDGFIPNDQLPIFIHLLTAAKAAILEVDGERLPVSLAGTSAAIDALDQFSRENNLHLPPPFHDTGNQLPQEVPEAGLLTKVYGYWRLITDSGQKTQIIRYTGKEIGIDFLTPADGSGMNVTLRTSGKYSGAELIFGNDQTAFPIAASSYDSASGETIFTLKLPSPLDAPLMVALTDNSIGTVILAKNGTVTTHLVPLNCVSCIIRDVGIAHTNHTSITGLSPLRD